MTDWSWKEMCMPVFGGGKVGREKNKKKKNYGSMENML